MAQIYQADLLAQGLARISADLGMISQQVAVMPAADTSAEPAWATNLTLLVMAMQRQLQQQLQQLAPMQQQLGQLVQDMAVVKYQAAVSYNRGMIGLQKLIGVPVMVAGPAFGTVPNGFPDSASALEVANIAEVDELLGEYGQPTHGSSDQRLMRLAEHIGARIGVRV